jgi:peptidoglycan-associated lipoprotein
MDKGNKMYLKFLALLAAALMVSACESSPEEAATADTGTAGAGAVSGSMGDVQPGTQEELVVKVGDRIFFGFDRADVTSEAQQTLQRVSSWMSQYPQVTITIEGHCDERGTREYNLALGERRAAATKSYLVALGVSPDRLSTISYGKERPAVLGSNESAWAQNRRAVFVVN